MIFKPKPVDNNIFHENSIKGIKSNYITTNPLRGIYEIEKLYNIVSTFGGIIAGGYARYCASPRLAPIPSNDIDIFFPSQILYLRFLSNYKHKFFYGCKDLYSSTSAYTISPSPNSEFSHLNKIQFINPEFSGDNILDCINLFDFTICRAAILDLDTIIIDHEFKNHENQNILISRFIKNPIGFFSRLIKYNSMGYNIPPSEIYKMFESWDNLDESQKSNIINLLKNNDIKKLAKNNIGLDYDLSQNITNSIYLKLLRFIPQMEHQDYVDYSSLPF